MTSHQQQLEEKAVKVAGSKKEKRPICFCVVVVVVVVVPTLYRHAGQKDEVLHGNLPPIPFNDYQQITITDVLCPVSPW